jgi:predicted nucleotidyltransferase component of viral defense system
LERISTKEKEMKAEEILKEFVNIYNGKVESETICILDAMEKYAEQQNKIQKEEIRQWLISEDFEGLAEKL